MTAETPGGDFHNLLIRHVPGTHPLRLEDVILICGTSIAYSRDLQRGLIPGPFDEETEFCEEEAIKRLVRIEQDDRVAFELTGRFTTIAELDRTVVPFNLTHSYSYFHFLIEWLPSLLMLVKRSGLPPDALIATGMLHPNAWQAMQLIFGPYGPAVLQLRTGQAVICRRAAQIRPSFYGAELIAGGIREMYFNVEDLMLSRRSFKKLWAPGPRTRKLFIRRVSRLRKILNNDEVEAAAEAAGYDIVDPSKLNFIDQIRLFSQASHIVGPTGGWIANIIFAPDEARVVAFHPSTIQMSTSPWRPMARIFGMELDGIFCSTPTTEGYATHPDYLVPLEDLRAAL